MQGTYTMMDQFDVAIVDYGLGNQFSVKNACETVGLGTIITSEKELIRSARVVVLPGVGAFGDAMASLISSGFCLKKFDNSIIPYLIYILIHSCQTQDFLLLQDLLTQLAIFFQNF